MSTGSRPITPVTPEVAGGSGEVVMLNPRIHSHLQPPDLSSSTPVTQRSEVTVVTGNTASARRPMLSSTNTATAAEVFRHSNNNSPARLRPVSPASSHLTYSRSNNSNHHSNNNNTYDPPKSPGRIYSGRASPNNATPTSPARNLSQNRSTSMHTPVSPGRRSFSARTTGASTPTSPRRTNSQTIQRPQPTNSSSDRNVSGSNAGQGADAAPGTGNFDPYNSALYRAALHSVHNAQLNQQRGVSSNNSINSNGTKNSFHHFDDNQHNMGPQQSAIRQVPSSQSSASGSLGAKPAWFRGDASTTASDQHRPEQVVTNVPQRRRNSTGRKNYSSNHSDPGNGVIPGEEHSQHAQSWAPENSKLPQDVIVLLKGGVMDSHSSHMLAYASPVLAKRLTPISHGRYRGKQRVDIPNGNVDEWKILKPFLQPHAVERANVTTQNFATLLPWFHELDIAILLKECDALLSTLTFTNPQREEPTNQDWHDILILAQISNHVKLDLTWQRSMDTLNGYLLRYPGYCAREKNLKLMMDLLRECPMARNFLWQSVANYLPQDLLDEYKSEGDVATKLVKSRLFPFLWREGVKKHANAEAEKIRKAQEKERLRKWKARRKAVDYSGDEFSQMDQSNSLLKESFSREPSWMQEDPSFDEPVDVSSVPHVDEDDEALSSEIQRSLSSNLIGNSDKALEEFAGWWYSWSQGKNDDSSGMYYGDESNVPERSTWLFSVLKRLKQPSIFATTNDSADSQSAISRGSTRGGTPSKARRQSPAKMRGDTREFAC